MHTKNKNANINEIDRHLIEEALDAIKQEVEDDLTVKPNAFYLPSNERMEKEMLSSIVSYLHSSIEAKMLNSKNGKRASYEEDDLMEYMNEGEVVRVIELKNKPYFARLNYAENGEKLGQVLYIGEENISANIKSWKEPIAQLYYKKPFHEKVEIDGKQLELDMLRELTIEQGELKILHPEQRKAVDVDPQLFNKLAEKKGAQMNALIDSLQAEQYELIQLPIKEPIVVQGSAGSGKSVIALHRLSYILYNLEQLEANRIAIIGPNKLFLNHIKNVLPQLGDEQIVQTTLQQVIEDRLRLTNEVRQVERLLLSEVQDLSIKEGRAQVEKDFYAFSDMRKIKGSLAYKDYMEHYTKYIVANLAPFIKNITHGPFVISGIEIAKLIEQTPHFGDSKEQLKNVVASTFKQQLHELNQIHETLATVTTQQVDKFIEVIEMNELLLRTTKAIEQQKEVVRRQHQHVQLMQTKMSHRNYRQMLSAEEFEQIATIENVMEREARFKQLANENQVEATRQLAENKKQLEDMFLAFTKEQIQVIVEKIAQLIVLEKKATQQIKMQFEHYCQLLHKPYILAQATDLLDLPSYLSAQQLQVLVEELSEELLTELNDSWKIYKTRLLSELYEKLLQELTGNLAERLEEILLAAHHDLKDMQLFIRHVHRHHTVFKSEVLPDFTTVFREIDAFYTHTVEQIYHQVVQDQFKMGHQFAQGVDIQLLAQYPIIESHDLPALYSIYKLIHPTTHQPFQYIIVDEAQDYSLYEMAILKDLTEQIMLMGDLGQNITPGNKLNSWQSFEPVIGEFRYYELKATFRSTKQIVEFANDIIKNYSNGKYSLPQLAFRNGEKVNRISRSGQGVYLSIREEIDKLLAESSEQARTVIIAKTMREARLVYEQLNHPAVQLQLSAEFVDAKVVITTLVLAKGLEYDNVLLFRFNNYLKTDEYDSKLAYIAASRALHKLYVYS